MAEIATESPLADELLDGSEAIARYTGIPRMRVFYLAERGLLPTFKVGSRWCALKSELRAALRSRPRKSDRVGGTEFTDTT